MKRKTALLLIVSVCVLVLCSLWLAAKDVDPADRAPAKTGKDQCLACHGPFEKLASDTAGFKAKGGEVGTPHRYVPHDTKDIPECDECHTPHALPAPDATAAKNTATVDKCYDGCHHTKTLEKCSECH